MHLTHKKYPPYFITKDATQRFYVVVEPDVFASLSAQIEYIIRKNGTLFFYCDIC